MAIPGTPTTVQVREVARGEDWGTCRGRVVRCPGRGGQRGQNARCDTLIEVIEGA